MTNPPQPTEQPGTPVQPDLTTTPTTVADTPVAPAAGATAAAPRRTGAGWATVLPWALVAVLTGLSVFLGTMLWQTQKELSRATTAPTSAPATAGGQTQAATAGPAPAERLTAQPTTGEKAAQLAKLAHRKAGDPMAIGKVDAPITIIEWADYRCPFCAKWALETKPALMPYVESGSVRIEFRDLVIFGDESQLAHQAARAAGKQGKYWEYYNEVWKLHTGQGHPAFDAAKAEAAAKAAGVPDLAQFKRDMTAADVVAAVKADTTEATSLGLSSTPFFLVNTTPVSGALPTAQFIDLLEQYGAKK